jgi:hypothetical protein
MEVALYAVHLALHVLKMEHAKPAKLHFIIRAQAPMVVAFQLL